jgi:hypothetical protein
MRKKLIWKTKTLPLSKGKGRDFGIKMPYEFSNDTIK